MLEPGHWKNFLLAAAASQLGRQREVAGLLLGKTSLDSL
jgi:hypothetical protein